MGLLLLVLLYVCVRSWDCHMQSFLTYWLLHHHVSGGKWGIDSRSSRWGFDIFSIGLQYEVVYLCLLNSIGNKTSVLLKESIIK